LREGGGNAGMVLAGDVEEEDGFGSCRSRWHGGGIVLIDESRRKEPTDSLIP
jgi:hypothetical protein